MRDHAVFFLLFLLHATTSPKQEDMSLHCTMCHRSCETGSSFSFALTVCKKKKKLPEKSQKTCFYLTRDGAKNFTAAEPRCKFFLEKREWVLAVGVQLLCPFGCWAWRARCVWSAAIGRTCLKVCHHLFKNVFNFNTKTFILHWPYERPL